MVTFNMKDSRAPSIEPHDLGIVHPDAFLLINLICIRVGSGGLWLAS